jgi:hypothetical protein
MKISVAQLKTIDYKQFAVDHGEKIVMGLVAVFVFLALLLTNWAPYPKDPSELSAKVKDGRTRLTISQWPVDKRQEFRTTRKNDIRVRVNTMLSALNVTPFKYTEGPLFRPLIPPQEPIDEPHWLAVEDLRAVFGRFVLAANQPDERRGGNADLMAAVEKPETPESEIPLEFRPRRGTGRTRRAAAPRVDDPARLRLLRGEDDEEAEREEREERRERRLRSTQSKRPRVLPQNAVGHGKRFVSLTGVFDLKRQLKLIGKAMSDLQQESNLDNVSFLDIEIQRQSAVQGDDPWSREWEPVDIETTLDVLREALDLDADIVDIRISDYVITMPLPMRGYGFWTPEVASHPRIENFQLSDSEMEQQQAIADAVIKAFEEKEKKKPERPPRVGGFAPTQHDMRGTLRRVRGRKDGARSAANRAAGQIADKQDLQKSLARDLEQRMTAVNNLLLVRFFDFDLESGNSYRYRVRLELNNPNYGRELHEVVHAGVRDGQMRVTDWSEPSDAVYVPFDFKTYLAGVDVPRGSRQETALIDVFEWLPSVGTTINDIVKTQLGQVIGGSATTLVLDPVQDVFAEMRVTFQTTDVLVDVAGSPVVSRNLHPDLGLEPMRGGRLEMPDRALLVNEYGEIIALDPISRESERAWSKKLVEFERIAYQDRIQASEAPSDRRRLQRGDDDDDDRERDRKRKKRPNPRRRRDY